MIVKILLIYLVLLFVGVVSYSGCLGVLVSLDWGCLKYFQGKGLFVLLEVYAPIVLFSVVFFILSGLVRVQFRLNVFLTLVFFVLLRLLVGGFYF